MKLTRIITILLLVFVAVSVAWLLLKPGDKDATPSPDEGKTARNQVIAYYFHGRVRCANCIKIEQLSKDVIEKDFAAELAEKKLQFLPVNTSEPANEHYVKDYQLSSNSLVLVLYKDGRQIKWETLPEVWNLLDDELRFKAYVRENVAKMLGELG